jgi:hypothetical protein
MLDLEKWRAVLGDPGHLYNIGNGLMLAGGVGGAVFAAMGDGVSPERAIERIADHFIGTPPAVALTLATLVFIAGGAAYSKAWRNGGQAPDPVFNRRGDVLSAVGAAMLGIGLMMLGDALLATFAGLLHAGGKLGSAYAGKRRVRTPFGSLLLADICKDAVLVSRLPALLAAITGLLTVALAIGRLESIVLALSVIVSTVYWALADILLLRRNGPMLTALRHRHVRRNGRRSPAD